MGSLLREEQTKVVKIDSAKKALENEVRSLSVKIEEIETNSVATSKRTIQKMEIRITELETMINEEKKSHSVTMTELHKRDRSIKELILQSEEDRKNIIILQESLDKLNEKVKDVEEREVVVKKTVNKVNIGGGTVTSSSAITSSMNESSALAESSSSALNAYRSGSVAYRAGSVARA